MGNVSWQWWSLNLNLLQAGIIVWLLFALSDKPKPLKRLLLGGHAQSLRAAWEGSAKRWQERMARKRKPRKERKP